MKHGKPIVSLLSRVDREPEAFVEPSGANVVGEDLQSHHPTSPQQITDDRRTDLVTLRFR